VGDGRPYDLILDPVGGPSWKHGYALLGPAGRIVAFGLSGATGGKTRNLWKALTTILQVPKFSPLDLSNDNKTVSGCNMGHLFDHIELLRPQFAALIELYKAGQISPHVGEIFTFEQAALAHHYLHDRKAVGKVLLVP
jgi:synaptic vesicle membrane protein VAT-1